MRTLKQCYRETREEADELRALLTEQSTQLQDYRVKVERRHARRAAGAGRRSHGDRCRAATDRYALCSKEQYPLNVATISLNE